MTSRMNKNKLAGIIRKYRKAEGLTIYEAGKILDVSYARVSQWENGETIPLQRIRFWKIDPEKPEWVRQMAEEMLKEPVGDERAVENG
jgi:transcriptional regulator with XRE-family HTH domain